MRCHLCALEWIRCSGHMHSMWNGVCMDHLVREEVGSGRRLSLPLRKLKRKLPRSLPALLQRLS